MMLAKIPNRPRGVGARALVKAENAVLRVLTFVFPISVLPIAAARSEIELNEERSKSPTAVDIESIALEKEPRASSNEEKSNPNSPGSNESNVSSPKSRVPDSASKLNLVGPVPKSITDWNESGDEDAGVAPREEAGATASANVSSPEPAIDPLAPEEPPPNLNSGSCGNDPKLVGVNPGLFMKLAAKGLLL